MLQFPKKIVNANQFTNPNASDIQNTNNLISNFINNISASDTLYLYDANDLMASNYGVGKPESTYDNYFNFDSLFTPTAYCTDQQQAVEIYF